MDVFYAELNRDSVTYSQLLYDINCQREFNRYCKIDDYYSVFKNIIVSILLDEDIVLFDSDFSDDEIYKLGQNEKISFKPKTINISVTDVKQLMCKINSSKKWRINLFTSGTTGVPKKISHSFESITRNCFVEEKFKNDIWGFAYNPTHMAGIQVFFQALLNNNPIVRLFNYNPDDIRSFISDMRVTNISATPTFYRMLIEENIEINSIKKVTSGGEKLDNALYGKLMKMFPNATIRNVYASTEAGSVLTSSNGDLFKISEKYSKLVKIENGELLLHNDLLGSGAEDKIVGDWYHTGDIVEYVDESSVKFRFVSRKNEMINVGGYKVNPSEVEEFLLMIPGVKEARVFSKKSSVLGQIVIAEVVSVEGVTEQSIRKFMVLKLQEFKIPRIIKFVSEIEKTRTGKIQR